MKFEDLAEKKLIMDPDTLKKLRRRAVDQIHKSPKIAAEVCVKLAKGGVIRFEDLRLSCEE